MTYPLFLTSESVFVYPTTKRPTLEAPKLITEQGLTYPRETFGLAGYVKSCKYINGSYELVLILAGYYFKLFLTAELASDFIGKQAGIFVDSFNELSYIYEGGLPGNEYLDKDGYFYGLVIGQNLKYSDYSASLNYIINLYYTIDNYEANIFDLIASAYAGNFAKSSELSAYALREHEHSLYISLDLAKNATATAIKDCFSGVILQNSKLVFSTINGNSLTVSLAEFVNTPQVSYTLPQASNNILGGIKLGYELTGKNYPVLLDSQARAYVNVPWEAGATPSPAPEPTLVSYTAGPGLIIENNVIKLAGIKSANGHKVLKVTSDGSSVEWADDLVGSGVPQSFLQQITTDNSTKVATIKASDNSTTQVSMSSHTHLLSLQKKTSGTADIVLDFGTKYELTSGGKSLIIKTPDAPAASATSSSSSTSILLTVGNGFKFENNKISIRSATTSNLLNNSYYDLLYSPLLQDTLPSTDVGFRSTGKIQFNPVSGAVKALSIELSGTGTKLAQTMLTVELIHPSAAAGGTGTGTVSLIGSLSIAHKLHVKAATTLDSDVTIRGKLTALNTLNLYDERMSYLTNDASKYVILDRLFRFETKAPTVASVGYPGLLWIHYRHGTSKCDLYMCLGHGAFYTSGYSLMSNGDGYSWVKLTTIEEPNFKIL